jgi:hypothetical protein
MYDYQKPSYVVDYADGGKVQYRDASLSDF